MRFLRRSLAVLFFFAFSASLPGQQTATTVKRDPQAVAILQQSLMAMGGNVPSDSAATGALTIVAGTSTQTGNVSILTRGTEQTSEQILTSQVTYGTVYSNMEGAKTGGSASTQLSAEEAATSRSVVFPLVLIASALNNADFSFSYIGLESTNGVSANHVRYWNTFHSHPKLQFLAEFTVTDIWIDATSGLPQRVSQTRRTGRGSEPGTVLDTYYSNYQKVRGVAYPFLVHRSLNGSTWITITIANVAFNTGLTDSSFPIQ